MSPSPAMTACAEVGGRPTPAIRCWLAACCLLLTLPAAATERTEGERKAIALLERMLSAMQTQGYTGTFVYLHGNQLESLRITRSLQGGRELERLVSLNGNAREVHSDRSAVTCVTPGSRTAAIEQRAPGGGLWPQLNPDLQQLRGHYLLHLLGEFRVAGRPSQVVGIIPKDKLRYGYRFYLDQESGLPLKTDLMSEGAQPVEQIMFTSLELIPDDGRAAGPPPPLPQVRPNRSPGPSTGSGTAKTPSSWAFTGLPAGFTLQLRDHWIDDAGHRIDHFLLSDGLASVSVYVEATTGKGLQGGANVGAVNAWGGVVAQHQITAVGEVPAQTVQRVVEALAYRGGDRTQ